MDGALVLILLCVVMLIGSYVAGMIPLVVQLVEVSIRSCLVDIHFYFMAYFSGTAEKGLDIRCRTLGGHRPYRHNSRGYSCDILGLPQETFHGTESCRAPAPQQ